MASKEIREIRDRLDNRDPKVCVVPLDLKESQARRVPLELKAPRVTKDTPVTPVFKEFRVPLDLRVLPELRDLPELPDLKVLLDPRDPPVSLVKMGPPVPLDPPV